jgi:hypothetical protein
MDGVSAWRVERREARVRLRERCRNVRGAENILAIVVIAGERASLAGLYSTL